MTKMKRFVSLMLAVVLMLSCVPMSAVAEGAATEPTQPAATEPTQPAVTTPTQPGATTPTQPAATTPTQPAATTPTQPDATTPTQPAATTPTQPDATTPTQPAATTPTQPDATTPTQPDATTPTQPDATTPTQPDSTTPTEPVKPVCTCSSKCAAANAACAVCKDNHTACAYIPPVCTCSAKCEAANAACAVCKDNHAACAYIPPVCSCTAKCAAANAACAVCKDNHASCGYTEPERIKVDFTDLLAEGALPVLFQSADPIHLASYLKASWLIAQEAEIACTPATVTYGEYEDGDTFEFTVTGIGDYTGSCTMTAEVYHVYKNEPAPVLPTVSFYNGASLTYGTPGPNLVTVTNKDNVGTGDILISITGNDDSSTSYNGTAGPRVTATVKVQYAVYSSVTKPTDYSGWTLQQNSMYSIYSKSMTWNVKDFPYALPESISHTNRLTYKSGGQLAFDVQRTWSPENTAGAPSVTIHVPQVWNSGGSTYACNYQSGNTFALADDASNFPAGTYTIVMQAACQDNDWALDESATRANGWTKTGNTWEKEATFTIGKQEVKPSITYNGSGPYYDTTVSFDDVTATLTDAQGTPVPFTKSNPGWHVWHSTDAGYPYETYSCTITEKMETMTPYYDVFLDESAKTNYELKASVYSGNTRYDGATVTIQKNTVNYRAKTNAVLEVEYDGSSHAFANQLDFTNALGAPLTEEKYTVKYRNAAGELLDAVTEIGTYTMVVEPRNTNMYTMGSNNPAITVEITPIDISGSDKLSVTLEDAAYIYNKDEKKPLVTSVKWGDTLLKIDQDYTVAYNNNVNASDKAEVIIRGKGAYGGEKTVNFTIDPKPLYVTGVFASKVYDGSKTGATTIDIRLDGKVGDDVVTATANIEFADKDVGINKPITASEITLSNANYTPQITQLDGTGSIAQRDITIDGIAAVSRAYNGSRAVALNLSGMQVHNIVAGETLDVTVTGTVETPDAGTGKVVTLSAIRLADTETGKVSNYALAGQQRETTVNITANSTSITVTAGSATKYYDGKALTVPEANVAFGNASVSIASTRQNGAVTDFTLNTGDVLRVTVNGTIEEPGEVTNVPTAEILRGEADVSANYAAVTTVNGKLNVVKNAVTITITPDSAEKVYDTTPLTCATAKLEIKEAAPPADYEASAPITVTAAEFKDGKNVFTLSTGHVLTVAVDGTLTDVKRDADGKVTGADNTATYQMDGLAAGKTVQDYYNEIKVEKGTLTVKPYPIKIVVNKAKLTRLEPYDTVKTVKQSPAAVNVSADEAFAYITVTLKGADGKELTELPGKQILAYTVEREVGAKPPYPIDEPAGKYDITKLTVVNQDSFDANNYVFTYDLSAKYTIDYRFEDLFDDGGVSDQVTTTLGGAMWGGYFATPIEVDKLKELEQKEERFRVPVVAEGHYIIGEAAYYCQDGHLFADILFTGNPHQEKAVEIKEKTLKVHNVMFSFYNYRPSLYDVDKLDWTKVNMLKKDADISKYIDEEDLFAGKPVYDKKLKKDTYILFYDRELDAYRLILDLGKIPEDRERFWVFLSLDAVVSKKLLTDSFRVEYMTEEYKFFRKWN